MLFFILWLGVSIASVGTILRATRPNTANPYCGIGAISRNLAGESQAPMQYRMLQAWIFNALNRFFDFVMPPALRVVTQSGLRISDRNTRAAYIMTLVIGLWIALSSSFALFSTLVPFPFNFFSTFLLLIFFLITAQYDYADVYYEVAFFALMMLLLSQGTVFLALIVMFVSAFNKESSAASALLPFAYYDIFSSTIIAIWLAGAWMLARMILERKYGVLENYVIAMWGTVYSFRTNAKLVMAEWKNVESTMWISFLMIALSAIALAVSPEHAMFALFFIASTTALGMITEPRIYMPLCIIFIPALIPVVL